MKKTAMIANKYLGQYRLLVRLSRSSIDEYAAAESQAHSITSIIGKEGGGGSPSRDSMQNAAIRMIEHAEYLDSAGDALTRAWEERNEVICAVGNKHPLWADVLECLYVRGMSVSEMGRWLASDRNHPYERTSLYRLRERALEKAYEAMEELGILDEGVDLNAMGVEDE